MRGIEALAPFKKTLQAIALPHVHGWNKMRTNTQINETQKNPKKIGRAAPPYSTFEESP